MDRKAGQEPRDRTAQLADHPTHSSAAGAWPAGRSHWHLAGCEAHYVGMAKRSEWWMKPGWKRPRDRDSS